MSVSTGKSCKKVPPDSSADQQAQFEAFRKAKEETSQDLLRATTAEPNSVDMDLVRAKQLLRVKDRNLADDWPDYPFPDAMKQYKLYDHQIIGAAVLYDRDVDQKIEYPRALIADDMGLGKTLMIVIGIVARVIEAITSEEYTKPTVIAAPVAVPGEWASTMQRYGLEVVSIWTDNKSSTSFQVKQYDSSSTKKAPDNETRATDDEFEALFTKRKPSTSDLNPEYEDRRNEFTTRLVVLTTPETLRERALDKLTRREWCIDHGMAPTDGDHLPEPMFKVNELWIDRFDRLVLEEAQCI